MSTDIFSNFGALDELIQVVYQSIYRFVAISSVSDDKWTIHLGLAGSEGRWWKGVWTEEEVHETLGSKASESIVEQFSEKLSELFVGGEVYIGNANPTPQAKLKFTIGPAAKKPTSVELEEMSPSEAAEFATTIFLDIALQAQSRRGRLHGSSMPYPTFTSTSTSAAASTISSSSKGLEPSSLKKESSQKPSRVEAELSRATPSSPSRPPGLSKAQAKPTGAPLKRPAPAPAPKVPAARPKGASLANPNKKARKYQAVEFDDDD